MRSKVSRDGISPVMNLRKGISITVLRTLYGHFEFLIILLDLANVLATPINFVN